MKRQTWANESALEQVHDTLEKIDPTDEVLKLADERTQVHISKLNKTITENEAYVSKRFTKLVNDELWDENEFGPRAKYKTMKEYIITEFRLNAETDA
jgi:hypothetical protein